MQSEITAGKRFRVVLHVDVLTLGGLEKKVMQLALGLDRARFEPIVTYSDASGSFPDELRAQGVAVHRIIIRTPREPEVGETVRQIRELGPDIFHSFSCRRNIADVWAARQAGVPVVMTARDNMRHWATPGPASNWEFDRNALTDYVTPCCRAVGQLVQAIEGIHAEKLAVIHNGVEMPATFEGSTVREELAVGPGVFLVGYAAKYRALKAHDMLLRAWRKVAAAVPNAFLVCCGEDDKNRHRLLQELVCELGLSGRVALLGPRCNMDAFYRGLDLYVHASRSEGFSISVLEAMSHGLPVVATAVGGAGEAIEHEVSGITVAPEAARLAASIVDLAGDPELRRVLGEAARERVRRHFSLSSMVQGFESLYERALRKEPLAQHEPPHAPAFTGSLDAQALDDVTVFVTTIGDTLNFADCMAHLAAQTARCCIEVIDRLAPMSAAFAQMQARCSTAYYVQVDEDMMLYANAVERLHELIAASDPSVPLVCAPLWDCDSGRPILGVKIYRHEIAKQFPYKNRMGCDVEQLGTMAAAGYHALLLSCREDDAVCLGEHGKHYTPESIFLRWQRLFHKRNEKGDLDWLDPWPARLLERYTKTRDRVHLYAALGAIAGVAGRAETHHELDWRDTIPALQRFRHYFPEAQGPASEQS